VPSVKAVDDTIVEVVVSVVVVVIVVVDLGERLGFPVRGVDGFDVVAVVDAVVDDVIVVVLILVLGVEGLDIIIVVCEDGFVITVAVDVKTDLGDKGVDKAG
jgi:hypothetical protein